LAAALYGRARPFSDTAAAVAGTAFIGSDSCCWLRMRRRLPTSAAEPACVPRSPH